MRDHAPALHETVTLAAKVTYLRLPGSYAGRIREVRTIETHMAWVFLAGDEAYKLKKPVRRSFLDFSTVSARRWACHEELRLNRALAPDVYRAVVPLAVDPMGRLELGGPGPAVDWLVKMRRLPEARRLDLLLRSHAVPRESLQRVGVVLSCFFRRAPAVCISPAEYVLRLERELQETRRAFRAHTYGVSGALLDAIAVTLRDLLVCQRHVVGARASRLREGHGDLRPQHVFLEATPVIIDCIEFNPDFRRLDPVDELSYLAMECERLGAPEAGEVVLESYARHADDVPQPTLVNFYKGLRAFVRAKIALWHLHDSDVARPERWVERGREYLRLAAAHAGNDRRE